LSYKKNVSARIDITANPKSPRLKLHANRARLRKLGLRPIQIWVPDTRARAFRAAARRQSKGGSAKARADQRFIDAVSDWGKHPFALTDR